MKSKVIIHTILASIAVCLLSSCISGLEREDKDAKHIKLSVVVPSVEVKSPVNGEDRFNENIIRSVYYFFYPEGVDDQSPVVTGSFSGLSITSTPDDYWHISVSQESVNRLFPTGHRRCHLVVIANPTSNMISTLRSTPDYATLKNIKLTSDLSGVQDSFVMTFDGLVELTSYTAQTVLQYQAELKRLANKITVTALVNKTHADTNYPGVVWNSQVEGMHAWFVNGMNITDLSGNFDLISDDDANLHRFESDMIGFDKGADYDANTYRANIKAPFYSYPMKWDFEDPSEPYLLFELPVEHDGIYKTTYYKFMLSEKEMKTNKWYNITVRLNVLGSFYRNDPTQQYIRQTYQVLPWNDAYGMINNEPDHNVDANIEESRFLVFNQTEYVIYDQEELDIPFISSHALATDGEGYIVAGDVSTAQKPDYKTSNSVTQIQFDADPINGNKGSLFRVNGSVLEFRHELNNDITSATLDCTPWTFEVVVKHADDARYNELIRVIQYPSIYIVTERNSAGRNTDQNLWVNNGSYTTRHDVSNYGGAHRAGTGTGDNTSVDFTILSIGRLGSEMPYIIGDPRKQTVDNLGTWSPASASVVGLQSNGTMSTSNRTLSNYYPANDSSPEFRNVIAPKFRISTANGILNGNNISYDQAMKRCASYMEDGYPAGRWRLPTSAEIRFIINLSGKFIPKMFSTTANYWYSDGLLVVNNNNPTLYDGTRTSGSNVYTRCVYDEWYWEIVDRRINNNHSNKSFYWGDMSRDAVNALFSN